MSRARTRQRLSALGRAEEGTALVEFAISLPLILVVSYGAIDSMRLFWSYQAAVAGVRDATRYIARVAPDDICETGGSLSAYEARLATIIGSTIDDGALYPVGVGISNVTATLFCETTLGLRQARVPVVTVSADLGVQLPMTGILALVGGSGYGTLTTTVVEQARIYGL
jgi:Flp pilus assembly protein TadG